MTVIVMHQRTTRQRVEVMFETTNERNRPLVLYNFLLTKFVRIRRNAVQYIVTSCHIILGHCNSVQRRR